MHQMISLMGCWIFKKITPCLQRGFKLPAPEWMVGLSLSFWDYFQGPFAGDLAKKQHVGPTKHENEKWRTCQWQFFVTFLGWLGDSFKG